MGCGKSTEGAEPKQAPAKGSGKRADNADSAVHNFIPCDDDSDDGEIFESPRHASLQKSGNSGSMRGGAVGSPAKGSSSRKVAWSDDPGVPQTVSVSKANCQEPPQVGDSESFTVHPQAPLPKGQVEEAAKLTELRKKFDNERYNKADKPSASSFPPTPTTTMTTTTNTLSVVPTAVVPTHTAEPSGAFLPPGFLEDLETDFSAVIPSTETQMIASKLGDGGVLDDSEPQEMSGNSNVPIGHQFDEQDEALMKEIMAEFEDL